MLIPKDIYHPEYQLTEEVQHFDVLVIKQDLRTKVNSSIAEIFRRRNVIEYKGCGDSLNMAVIQETMGYTAMYFSLRSKPDHFRIHDVTASVFRYSFPRKLYKELRDMGIEVAKKARYL